MEASANARPIRVLQPFGAIVRTTNPYIAMLHQALEQTPGVEPLTFSYGRALRGGYDVVHMHWPETRLGGRTASRRAVRLLLAYLYVLRLRVFRIPIVRTMHNLELPSGLSRLDYGFLRLVERWTTLHILLNETTPPTGRPSVTILHGHYRNWFSPYPPQEPTVGRLGYAGLVRRYKNVVGLLTAFGAARERDPSLTLVVAGMPSGDRLEGEIRAAAGDGVELDFRFLDDPDLVQVVTSSELVVLPYRHMHNSGTVLLALSLDRPVLVPANAANEALSDEVGPGWVLVFDGELDGPQLLDAVEDARAPRSDRPDLSRREWADAGSAHLDAYRHAIALRASRSA